MTLISEDARIHQDAKIGNNVRVGAFSVIGPNVEIGDDTVIGPHVVIEGHTSIGKNNEIFQFTSIGTPPQHKGHKGEPTRVEIGDRNVLREFISVHCGTMLDNGVTRIGNDNMLMAYVHIAHDCSVANSVTMANGASLAGHTHVHDHCILGGFALVHQFCRIGEGAFLGYGSGVGKDVPPFVMASGYPAAPHGVNAEGMRRRDISKADIDSVREAYRILYRNKLRLVEAKEQLAELADKTPSLRKFYDFLNESKRGILR